MAAINRSPTPPQVLFSASGIGFYGYGDPKEVFTESSDAGNDFLSRVTQDWEAAANQTANGCRLVIGRIGLVLGLDEGILGKLTPIFETGLGGVMGSGLQGMSWVHIYDLVDFIAHALLNERTEAFTIASPRTRSPTVSSARPLRKRSAGPASLKFPDWP